jgi:ABC-type Fe3+-hydroxamate transport system substrate-binding protein
LNKVVKGLVALFLLMSLTLTACGNSPSPTVTTAPATTAVATAIVATAAASASTTTGAVSPTPAATGGASRFPVTVSDGTGTSLTFAKKPERIICLSESCLDVLAELELPPPVATRSFMKSVALNPRIFGDKAKSVGVVGEEGSNINLETIAQYKPDLVIGWATQGGLREGLKTIAPLYIMPTIKDVNLAIEELRKLARVFDRNAQAEVAANRLTAKLAAYKVKSPRDKTILIMANFTPGNQQIVATDQDAVCNLLNEVAKCGLKAPPIFAGYAQVSLESILQADPQALFIISVLAAPQDAFPPDERQKQTQARTELQTSPFWKDITAVKNNRVYELDRTNWYGTPGTRSMGLALDDVMTKLYPDVFPKALP